MSDEKLIRLADAKRAFETLSRTRHGYSGMGCDGYLTLANATAQILDTIPAVQVGVKPEWLTNCAVCGRVVDTREQSQGGDAHGCECDDGWACSSECAEKLSPDPEWLVVQPSPDVVEIDLRAVMMEQLEQAAQKSPWVPPEYTMNEVVSDCCSFLRNPREPSPDVAALVEARRKHVELVDKYRTKRDKVIALREAGDWSQSIAAEFQAMEAGRRDFFEAAQTFADAALARLKGDAA